METGGLGQHVVHMPYVHVLVHIHACTCTLYIYYNNDVMHMQHIVLFIIYMCTHTHTR